MKKILMKTTLQLQCATFRLRRTALVQQSKLLWLPKPHRSMSCYENNIHLRTHTHTQSIAITLCYRRPNDIRTHTHMHVLYCKLNTYACVRMCICVCVCLTACCHTLAFACTSCSAVKPLTT